MPLTVDFSVFLEQCPCEAPGLADVYGQEFEELFTKYEREGRARRTIKAQELWFAILEAQIETGTPYILFKDACNEKSNQKNLGTIKCSNRASLAANFHVHVLNHQILDHCFDAEFLFQTSSE